LDCGSLESFRLDGWFVKWLQCRLEQIVWVGNEAFELATIIRSRSPAWIESGCKYLTLVVLKVVILILTLLNSRVECGFLPGKTLSPSFCLKLGTCQGEDVSSFASSFETCRMQIVVNLLVIAARQKIHTIDLRIGELVRW
jgi:hypothetical protein